MWPLTRGGEAGGKALVAKKITFLPASLCLAKNCKSSIKDFVLVKMVTQKKVRTWGAISVI